MEAKSIDGLTLFFDVEQREAAELIGRACEQATQLIQAHWGLDTPVDCRVYVMTSWLRFVLHAPPWPWRILVGITLPLRSLRISSYGPVIIEPAPNKKLIKSAYCLLNNPACP